MCLNESVNTFRYMNRSTIYRLEYYKSQRAVTSPLKGRRFDSLQFNISLISKPRIFINMCSNFNLNQLFIYKLQQRFYCYSNLVLRAEIFVTHEFRPSLDKVLAVALTTAVGEQYSLPLSRGALPTCRPQTIAQGAPAA